MADIYVKSSAGGAIGSGTYRGNWTASVAYALGDRVCGVAVSDYWMFECTTAGTAGATEPTWTKTDGVTTVDSGVTWTARIPSTWANPTLTLAKAASNDAAGDNIYLSQSHAESTASVITLALAGTVTNPTKIICVDDGAAPPTATSTTATVTTTGANAITINGSAYIYGVTFNTSTGATGSNLTIAGSSADNSYVVMELCNLKLIGTAGGNRISTGTASSTIEGSVTLKKCTFKFSAIGQGFTLNGPTNFIGCSIASDSSAITTLVASSISNNQLSKFIDCDLSYFASGGNLINVGGALGRIDFINCKLPESWSGAVITGTQTSPHFRACLYNCDSGATNYRLWIETFAGSIKSETTLVKTGGASDGTTSISWKLVTNANTNEYVAPLLTDDMAIWIDTTGSSKTITVDILHDSVTALTDADIWLEIDYLGSTSYPIGIPLSDKRATVLTTATYQTTSTATWTTTGLTNPNKQKLEVTFTPNMKGFVYARVCVAKPSYTLYVDPKPVVS